MARIAPTEVAQLLESAAADEGGDIGAADRLMPAVYNELRRVAQSRLAMERPDHTLQATALVHEAYLRMVKQTQVNWAGRTQFFAVASEMIRRILVDHARARCVLKRGGAAGSSVRDRLTLQDTMSDSGSMIDVLDLEEAMAELAALSERQHRVVELRFFGGLTVEETAHVLGVSPRTIKGDWRVACAWLRRRLGGLPGGHGAGLGENRP